MISKGISYLKNNHTWLFSGIGVFILGIFFSFFYSNDNQKIIQKREIIDYPSTKNIPIVPLTINENANFRKFLDQNENKIVRFDSNIELSYGIGLMRLANEACNNSKFIESVRKSPERISRTPIGLVDFSKEINEKEIPAFPKFSEYENQVFCKDSVIIMMKEPKRLRFSYGGTDNLYLPLSGTFIIEKRFLQGTSVEYLLREI